tara:strand:+ start:254 stop:490 length:237 start_codon:yes stop_codon:yes gene_type:complete
MTIETIKEQAELLGINVVMQWVACDNRLPEDEEIVLVYTYTGIDIYQFLDNQFYHYENGYVQNNVVTHWMPLPKPPCA